MKNPSECKHEKFETHSKVGRLTDKDGVEITGFVFECKVKCVECDTFFEFVGVPNGQSFTEPMANFDFTELRAPIRPNTGAIANNLSYQFERPKTTKNENRN